MEERELTWIGPEPVKVSKSKWGRFSIRKVRNPLNDVQYRVYFNGLFIGKYLTDGEAKDFAERYHGIIVAQQKGNGN